MTSKFSSGKFFPNAIACDLIERDEERQQKFETTIFIYHRTAEAVRLARFHLLRPLSNKSFANVPLWKCSIKISVSMIFDLELETKKL